MHSRNALSVLVFAFVLLVVPPATSRAGEAEVPPAQRIRDLEYRLAVATMRQEIWQSRTDHLVKLVTSALEELDAARRGQDAARQALSREIERLRGELDTERVTYQTERKKLREELETERRQRLDATRAHAKALALAKRERDHARREAASLAISHQCQYDAAYDLAKEVERLRWNLERTLPRDTVAGALSGVPAAHWRSELEHGDSQRRSVALIALRFLPDQGPGIVQAVLQAAASDNGLLDRAKATLVPLGARAVEALVAAGRENEPLPRAWVAYVLGAMGSEAEAALPWLEELAADAKAGRDAAAAKGAARKILEALGK